MTCGERAVIVDGVRGARRLCIFRHRISVGTMSTAAARTYIWYYCYGLLNGRPDLVAHV